MLRHLLKISWVQDGSEPRSVQGKAGALNHGLAICLLQAGCTRLQSVLSSYELSATGGSISTHTPEGRKGARKNASPHHALRPTSPHRGPLVLAFHWGLGRPVSLASEIVQNWGDSVFLSLLACHPMSQAAMTHHSDCHHPMACRCDDISLQVGVVQWKEPDSRRPHPGPLSCSPYDQTPDPASSFIKQVRGGVGRRNEVTFTADTLHDNAHSISRVGEGCLHFTDEKIV